MKTQKQIGEWTMKRKFSISLIGFALIFDLSCCNANETNNVDSMKKKTFCTQDEIVVFSCELENKKTVSLCGKDKQMRYSYGNLRKAPEFSIQGGKELFKLSHDSTTYAIFKGLGFNNNDYSYYIVQQSVIRKNDESVGIIVLKNSNEGELSKMVFGKVCTNNIIADNKVWYQSPYLTSDFTKSLNLLDNDDQDLLYFSDLLDKKK